MLEERVQLDHLKLNVRHSLSDKPAVLFLHFSGGNHHMWDGVIPQFIGQYSIIAPDLRGHGRSDKPADGYHIDRMAHDIHLLLQRLGVEQCHVIGSSMGAEIGLSLAACHPGVVLSLVCEGAMYNEFGPYGLFNGTVEEIEHKKQVLRDQLGERKDRVFTTVADYVAEERAKLPQELEWTPYFQAFFESNVEPLENGRFTYRYLSRVRSAYVQNYWDLKFEHYYGRLQCPVLFMPSQDEWEDDFIRSTLHVFANLLEQYEIERIPQSVHAYVWMQMPEPAGEAAKRFITKQADGPTACRG